MSRGIDIRKMVREAQERSEDGRIDFYLLMTVTDWLRATGRAYGPADDKCEVCGVEYDGSWTLFNYLDWHCRACTDAAFRAAWEQQTAAMAEAVA